LNYWYIARGERKAGPYPIVQLRAMAESGNLSPEDRLCAEGAEKWTPASEVPNVFFGDTAQWNPQLGYFGPKESVEPKSADFGQRFAAWWVDGVITYIGSGMLAGLLSGAINDFMRYRTFGWDNALVAQWTKIVVGIAGGWAYEALQLSSAQQATLGKRLVGIRVTDLDGRRLTLAKATVRYLAKCLSVISLGAGFLVALFTEKKQALHDILARTLVVKK
jgi:uncharacterized RDD family membrane protein YckC